MYKVRFLKGAEKNLEEILSYISGDNPLYAKEVGDKISYSINFLKLFPSLGKQRGDGLRELIEPKYKFRVLYKIDSITIYIVAIFKDKNDWN